MPRQPAVILQDVAPCIYVRPTAVELPRFQSCDQRTKPDFGHDFGWCDPAAPCFALPCIAKQVMPNAKHANIDAGWCKVCFLIPSGGAPPEGFTMSLRRLFGG